MSIEILDGGTPGTIIFDEILDGGSPSTISVSAIYEGGGVIRGDTVTIQAQHAELFGQIIAAGQIVVAQGDQTTSAQGNVFSPNVVYTSQKNQHVAAQGIVEVVGVAETHQHQYVTATGSVVSASGIVVTTQENQHVAAQGTVVPPVPPVPPVPSAGQYGGGLGGGGGVGGYVVSLSGFRRQKITVAVQIPGHDWETTSLDEFDNSLEVTVGDINTVRDNIIVSANTPRNILAIRPAYNLTEIINTRESNIHANVRYSKPEAQINDIITIDT